VLADRLDKARVEHVTPISTWRDTRAIKPTYPYIRVLTVNQTRGDANKDE
jgi:hypothetical protein